MSSVGQFTYMNDELYEFDSDELDISILLTVLCLIEIEHPGTISHAVYVAALAKDGWKFTAQSSNPPKARKAQEEFLRWLENHPNAVDPKGGTRYEG